MAINLTPELKAKLLNELQSLEMQLSELEEKKKQEEGAKASAPAPLSKEDEALEQIRIHDVPEYMRIMENRAMWEKRTAAKTADNLTPAEADWLGKMLQGVDATTYDKALSGIERLRPDLAKLLPAKYDQADIDMLLRSTKSKEQTPEDEIKSLNYSISVLGDTPTDLAIKKSLRTRLQGLLTTKYGETPPPPPHPKAAGDAKTDGKDVVEPVSKASLQSKIDALVWTNKPEVDKQNSAIVSEIDAAKSADTIPQSDATELKSNLTSKISEITPKPQKVHDETKEERAAFLDGNGVNLKGVAGAMALGQAMGPAIRKAIEAKTTELDQSNSQKLASLVYQTYNPGTLVSGEMTSAVNAAKGASYATQGLAFLAQKWGIQDPRIPIGKAVDVYNDGLAQGIEAYKEVTPSVTAYKQLLAKNNPGERINATLTEAYLLGLKNPSSYIIDGSGSLEKKTPVILYKKGYPRFNRNDGETYLAKEDLTAETAKLKSSWELKK